MTTLEESVSFGVYMRVDVSNACEKKQAELKDERVGTCITKEDAKLLIKKIAEEQCDGEDGISYFFSPDGLSCAVRCNDHGDKFWYILKCEEEKLFKSKPIENDAVSEFLKDANSDA